MHSSPKPMLFRFQQLLRKVVGAVVMQNRRTFPPTALHLHEPSLPAACSIDLANTRLSQAAPRVCLTRWCIFTLICSAAFHGLSAHFYSLVFTPPLLPSLLLSISLPPLFASLPSHLRHPLTAYTPPPPPPPPYEAGAAAGRSRS